MKNFKPTKYARSHNETMARDSKDQRNLAHVTVVIASDVMITNQLL